MTTRSRFALFALGVTTLFWLFPGGLNAKEKKPAAGKAETAAIEELSRPELLPRLRPGVTCRMFSSYDRSGGNDDGFAGTYSKLRVENGNSVLAEMTGPGCIQRIHLPHSIYEKPGLLGLKKEHIRIYLDGEKTPALDVPLEDLFTGKIDGFPQPLVGAGLGGHYCYVPIPYRNGCKVEVDGTAVKFYAVAYRTFPSAEGVVTFRNPPTARQRKALAAAAKAWQSCGDLSALHAPRPKRTVKSFSLQPEKPVSLTLPDGPRMVRAVYLTAEPEQLKNAGDVQLEIRWGDAQNPAVKLPLDFFFCQAMQPGEFQSLLVGSNKISSPLPLGEGSGVRATSQKNGPHPNPLPKGEGTEGIRWYNFMPMPYPKSAKITLRSVTPFAGKLEVLTVKLREWSDDLGYFHTAYHESLPTEKGKFHPWLKREGRGHFAGVYLVTEGQVKEKMPIWLEGDELFTCDGELRIHGTGTEDCFNCGWYAVPGRLMGPGVFPLHGFTVYRKDGEKNLAAMFRWFLPDPVPYEKSIQAEIEHGGINDVQADYRSATFFYDAAP
ncbi:MAG: DUF2961 domain-containing protein [Pirellulales bacterium]|nr:DUF2961 domain-containing protein [Pirellulales bacterium]